jgi:hypothetical protein
VFGLRAARGVRAVEAVVESLVGRLLAEGQPLEGQRRPFQLLNQQTVVKESSVLHPDRVLVDCGLSFVLHGANIIQSQIIIIKWEYRTRSGLELIFDNFIG